MNDYDALRDYLKKQSLPELILSFEQIEEIRVDLNPGERQAMMDRTGRRTVPQIFIGDTHVGGCDDLIALDQKGGLLPLLQAP